LAGNSSGWPVAEETLTNTEWIVDYVVGNPVLPLGGILLWQRERLGYVTAAGLLFLSGANGVAFTASQVVGALLANSSIDVVIIAVHLTIAAISFTLLVIFLCGAAGRRPVLNVYSGLHTHWATAGVRWRVILSATKGLPVRVASPGCVGGDASAAASA